MPIPLMQCRIPVFSVLCYMYCTSHLRAKIASRSLGSGSVQSVQSTVLAHTALSRTKAGRITVEADVSARLLFTSGFSQVFLSVSTLKPGLCVDCVF